MEQGPKLAANCQDPVCLLRVCADKHTKAHRLDGKPVHANFFYLLTLSIKKITFELNSSF